MRKNLRLKMSFLDLHAPRGFSFPRESHPGYVVEMRSTSRTRVCASYVIEYRPDDLALAGRLSPTGTKPAFLRESSPTPFDFAASISSLDSNDDLHLPLSLHAGFRSVNESVATYLVARGVRRPKRQRSLFKHIRVVACKSGMSARRFGPQQIGILQSASHLPGDAGTGIDQTNGRTHHLADDPSENRIMCASENQDINTRGSQAVQIILRDQSSCGVPIPLQPKKQTRDTRPARR